MLRTHAPGHSARLSSPPATVEPFAAPGQLRFYEVGSETGGLGNLTLARISSAWTIARAAGKTCRDGFDVGTAEFG